MVMKLKKPDDQKLMDTIDAHAREVKSKAAPEGIKTVLLHMPEDIHSQAKSIAAIRKIKLHDYFIEVIRKANG